MWSLLLVFLRYNWIGYPFILTLRLFLPDLIYRVRFGEDLAYILIFWFWPNFILVQFICQFFPVATSFLLIASQSICFTSVLFVLYGFWQKKKEWWAGRSRSRVVIFNCKRSLPSDLLAKDMKGTFLQFISVAAIFTDQRGGGNDLYLYTLKTPYMQVNLWQTAVQGATWNGSFYFFIFRKRTEAIFLEQERSSWFSCFSFWRPIPYPLDGPH